MKDYQYAVRKGYYERLNGNITLNGSSVAVYDTFAPNDAPYPFIILSTQTAVDDSTKRAHAQEVTMLLDVITGFTGAVQRIPVDTICNQIYEFINPVGGPFIDVGADLQVISTILLSDTTVEGQNDVWKIVRRLIRFGHKIHEQVIF